MQVTTKQQRKKNSIQYSEAASMAVIGCLGFNATKRVLAELRKLDPRWIVGYDKADGLECKLPFPSIQVKDNAELARRLQQQRPVVALIETPDDCHAEHIRIALEAGALLIICEKPIARTLVEAAHVLRLCQQARPKQQVFILDHYRNVEFARLLCANARRWLGAIRSLDVVLLESQGVPANQVRSHAQGMSNFIHHVPAIAGLLFDLHSLKVVDAVRAKHPDTAVPDTYRGAIFSTRGPEPVSIRGCVGKYIHKPTRRIVVEGTIGTATLDRSTHELQVACMDGWTLTMQMREDSGYRGLAHSLAGGKPFSTLLTVEQAVQALRLVEEANAIATDLKDYPDGSQPVFGQPKRRAA